MMPESGSPRVALVTGGSRGIGRAISLRLAADGCTVVVNYARDGEAASAVCADIEAAGGCAWSCQADVLDPAAVRAMFAAIQKRHDRLDVLINNAGGTHEALFALTPPDRFFEVVQRNLAGTVLCSNAALRVMIRQRSGCIVNISSAAGVRCPPGLSAYAASKAAVNALTQCMAKEMAGRGIRVNAVAPSWVETRMTDSGNAEKIREGVAHIPVGRIAQPEEVAAAVAALIRDDMSYVVGQVLLVDGGGVT